MAISPNEFQNLAEDVFTLYSEAELSLLHKISRHAYKGSNALNPNTWKQLKLSEINLVKKTLINEVNNLSQNANLMHKGMLLNAYKGGKNAFINEMFGKIYDGKLLPNNLKKVFSIMLELNNKTDVANRVILRKSKDAYAEIVGRSTAMLATGTISLREAVKHECNEFAKRGITSFVDKSGRAWEMDSYAEMATVTALTRATTSGYIDAMQEYGYDLAYISNNGDSCPLCIEWEGVVVSVSGENREYPSLDDAIASGLFHPNCRHHISTYYEGISKPKTNSKEQVEEKYTDYNNRARQRYYERQIRKYKKLMAVSGTPKDESEAFDKVQAYRLKIRNDLKNTKAQRKYYREGGSQPLSESAKKYRKKPNKSLQLSKTSANLKPNNIISAPIQSRKNADGNPYAISNMNFKLNNRQQKLIEKLPKFGSKVIVKKKEVSLKDLSALTAKTGDEFALFTRKGERMIVRGDSYQVPITIETAKKMNAENWRWTGHTHVGFTTETTIPSDGDIEILKVFSNEYSSIYNSNGSRNKYKGVEK